MLLDSNQVEFAKQFNFITLLTPQAQIGGLKKNSQNSDSRNQNNDAVL